MELQTQFKGPDGELRKINPFLQKETPLIKRTYLIPEKKFIKEILNTDAPIQNLSYDGDIVKINIKFPKTTDIIAVNKADILDVFNIKEPSIYIGLIKQIKEENNEIKDESYIFIHTLKDEGD